MRFAAYALDFVNVTALPAIAAVAVVAVTALPLPAEAAAASEAAAAKVKISRIWYDSPGVDNRSNTSLNGEYVTIANTGQTVVRLGGWTLDDASSHSYTFPGGVVIKPGKKITIKTGTGGDTATVLYQGRRAYVWNNDHDTATLWDPQGRTVHGCSYNSTRVDSINC